MAIPDGPLLLGIDIGTSRTKAVLVDAAGVEVVSAARPTPFARGPAGVETDVDALLGVVAGVMADLGARLRQVTGVGIAGLAESGAPLDAGGRPLAPVIAWHDPRGAEAVAVLAERFGDDLPLRTGQRLGTVSSVAKLGWLAANGVAGVRWWLGVPELCLQALTGARATDFSLAARTGAFDVVRRVPLPDVPDALGLPSDVFPEPLPAGAVMGTVSATGAAWSGLAAGIPVTVAGHDHLAGVAGSGAGDGDIVNSVGTAETVVGRTTTVPDVRSALERRAAVTVWPTGRGWVVLASGARAGLVLDGAARLLGHPLPELDGMAEGAGTVDVTAWVDAAAAAARTGTTSARQASPGPGAETRALPAGPPGAVWNGILHALAVRTWDAAVRVGEVGGPGRRLVVFGGGGRSRPWLRAKADQGHLPVVRSTAGEAVARGAALFAGVAAGWWPSPEAAPAPRLEPVPPRVLRDWAGDSGAS